MKNKSVNITLGSKADSYQIFAVNLEAYRSGHNGPDSKISGVMGSCEAVKPHGCGVFGGWRTREARRI